jgi:hypothetical protein
MSYPGSIQDARAAIKMVETDNEAGAASSPILNGQDSGGPAAKGDVVPKNYELGKHTTEFRREL